MARDFASIVWHQQDQVDFRKLKYTVGTMKKRNIKHSDQQNLCFIENANGYNSFSAIGYNSV